jgi:hypothetical protein
MLRCGRGGNMLLLLLLLLPVHCSLLVRVLGNSHHDLRKLGLVCITPPPLLITAAVQCVQVKAHGVVQGTARATP